MISVLLYVYCVFVYIWVGVTKAKRGRFLHSKYIKVKAINVNAIALANFIGDKIGDARLANVRNDRGFLKYVGAALGFVGTAAAVSADAITVYECIDEHVDRDNAEHGHDEA